MSGKNCSGRQGVMWAGIALVTSAACGWNCNGREQGMQAGHAIDSNAISACNSTEREGHVVARGREL